MAAVAVFGTATLALVDALVISPQEAAQAFADAQRRWDGRPFSHYRLVSESSSNDPSVGLGCQRDLEIQNEQVIHVFRNDCPGWLDGMTVTDIFSLFRGYSPQTVGVPSTSPPGRPVPTPHTPMPTPPGPKLCSVVLVASFDSQFGYPHSIETQTKPGIDGCVMLGDAPKYKVRILSLAPIP